MRAGRPYCTLARPTGRLGTLAVQALAVPPRRPFACLPGRTQPLAPWGALATPRVPLSLPCWHLPRLPADVSLPHARRRWASSRVGDAKYMNVGSGAQVQQLLFAGAANALSQGSKGVDKPPLPLERVFKVGAWVGGEAGVGAGGVALLAAGPAH